MDIKRLSKNVNEFVSTVEIFKLEYTSIPFYVVAPRSTIDLTLLSGEQIPIEQRNPAEVTMIGETSLAPGGVQVANPAFDVTPHSYVTALITEAGIARPPYTQSLPALCAGYHHSEEV